MDERFRQDLRFLVVIKQLFTLGLRYIQLPREWVSSLSVLLVMENR